MINEEQTKIVDTYSKEVRCPNCHSLLFKGQAQDVQIKCRKCGKVLTIKN